MDRIQIRGGAKLNGTIQISGAKNAALPLMIASLLTDQTLTLENLPRLADVNQLVRILGNHGVDYSIDGKRRAGEASAGQTAHLTARSIVDTTAPYELVSKMRASFWVIAPLLASPIDGLSNTWRMGEARVSLPGGCAIGTRPVDLLLMALERLGAKVDIDAGYVVATTPNGFIGGEVEFPKVTVGGTHTALMAAATAHGASVIRNAAREPEVKDLADCLNKMGARIHGAGTSTIEVTGVAKLNGARHRVLPDRRGGYFDRAVPRLCDRSAGPVHGADDARQGRLAHQGDDFRESFHACAGVGAVRGAYQAGRRYRDRRRRQEAARRAGDGDRSARLGFPGNRRPSGGGRNHGQSRLSS